MPRNVSGRRAAGKAQARKRWAVVASADELRIRLRKRTKRMDQEYCASRSMVVTAAAWFTAIVLGIMTLLTAYQLVQDPSSAGWYAVLWVVGGMTAMLFGYLFHGIPRSVTANSMMLSTYLVGFLAVPFIITVFTNFNFVVLVIAAVLGALFYLAASRYARFFTLYREGYDV